MFFIFIIEESCQADGVCAGERVRGTVETKYLLLILKSLPIDIIKGLKLP